MIYRLKNHLKNYSWGSKTAMSELFGFDNTEQKPQAELWMGAHSSGCSQIQVGGDWVNLSDFIASNPEATLGEKVHSRFGELPFLLKILSADTPLSIQVHPSKNKAIMGFSRENIEGISLNSPNRNYKDANHKPELIYALTAFKAMNGFREIHEILMLFECVKITALAEALNQLKKQPSSLGLTVFFTCVMSLAGDEKKQAIDELIHRTSQKSNNELENTAFALVRQCAVLYDNDIGLFAPLLLNIITLNVGQAMFLEAETPHAYVSGTGIEIMASSDNVLRSGLTSKHIDIVELLANIQYRSLPLKALLTKSKQYNNRLNFPVLVDDFSFDVINVIENISIEVSSAEILLCLTGSVTVDYLSIVAGESLFVSADSNSYLIGGKGRVVRAYNQL